MDRLFTHLLKNSRRFLILNTVLSMLFLSFAFQAKAEAEFLTPEEAFSLKVSTTDKKNLNLHFDIGKGYFLYQKHFKFMALDGKTIATNSITFPPAVEKKSGNTSHAVFSKQLDFKIAATPGDNNLKGIIIGYQGCSENGFCYNPLAKKITMDQSGIIEISDVPADTFPSEPSKNITTANATDTKLAKNSNDSSQTLASTTPTKTESSISETDRLADQLKGGSFLTLLGFFGFGILLALTPCVLPMVPILANILVGEDKPLTSSRSMLLATIYVLSMAACYAAAGVIAALIGTEMQTSLQSPKCLVGLSFILMLFALSQFNFIYVQFPPFISNFFSKFNIKHKQGSAIGACTMGLVSALMVSPCVTPALVGALTFIGQTGNIFLGGMALFVLALGMGTPMFIIALLGSHLLPKAGAWMTQVKNATGVLLMVLAATIFLRAFPSEALENQSNMAKSGPQVFASVGSQSELKLALEHAKKENQPVILDVYADWCVSCKQIDHDVFSNQHVLTSLQNAKLLRFDMTKQNADQEQLKKELGIIGPPTVLFFNTNGEEAKAYRLVGKIESNDFINHFNSFLNVKK